MERERERILGLGAVLLGGGGEGMSHEAVLFTINGHNQFNQSIEKPSHISETAPLK